MTFYRNIVWFYKGFTEYTKSGYQAASKKFLSSDLEVDCLDKVFMITGANSGIGKVIATEAAKRGGIVHMVCRNATAANAVKEEIKTISNNENIHVHLLDLSQPRAVCKFASKFVEDNERLDVLVNNAGCMLPRSVNEDDVDANFATNTLAPYFLSRLLEPLLFKSSDARVINVSSGGMLTQKLDKEDPQNERMTPYDPTMAYAHQKRQQVVFTEILAEKTSNVWFAVMHPGWADTPAVQSAMPDFYAKMKTRLRTAEEGADTAVWLSISPVARQNVSGLFYQDRSPVSTHLPLAWTKTSKSENSAFVDILEQFLKRFKV